MRICFVASEVAPLAKTGGLAESLAHCRVTCTSRRHDIRVFMPFYSSIGTAALQMVPVDGAQNVELRLGASSFSLFIARDAAAGSSVPLYLVHCPLFTTADDLHDRPDEHCVSWSCSALALEAVSG
jgi:starch synthase